MDRITIVDDEREIADLLELYLKSEGFEVVKYQTVGETLSQMEQRLPDLALLDVMLPDGDGFELCRRIREKHRFPIIMLTARVEDMDKITGLTIGADDYITKPFNPLEVIARVKAQLRRFKRYNEAGEENHEIFDEGGLIIDHATHSCTLYGENIQLTPFGIIRKYCEG